MTSVSSPAPVSPHIVVIGLHGAPLVATVLTATLVGAGLVLVCLATKAVPMGQAREPQPAGAVQRESPMQEPVGSAEQTDTSQSLAPLLCGSERTEVTSFEAPFVGDEGNFRNVGTGGHVGGFVVEAGDVDVMGKPLWQMACGSQALDLSGWHAGTIGADLQTQPGAHYLLSYVVATNPDPGTGGAGPKRLQVEWGDRVVETLILDPVGRSFQQMGWERHDVRVSANASTMHLRFRSLNESNSGPALDRVTLTPLPRQ